MKSYIKRFDLHPPFAFTLSPLIQDRLRELQRQRRHPILQNLIEWAILPANQLQLKIEYVAGVSLKNWIYGHYSKDTLNFDVPQVSRMLEQFSNELEHSQLIHGDLNPGNLILTGKGIVAIDWLIDLSSPQGTPLFSHPNLFKGKPRSRDTDKFAIDLIAAFVLKNKGVNSIYDG